VKIQKSMGMPFLASMTGVGLGSWKSRVGGTMDRLLQGRLLVELKFNFIIAFVLLRSCKCVVL
jgi:hypothetical protein